MKIQQIKTEQVLCDDDNAILQKASEEALRWHEESVELAQSRSNFQIEKFIAHDSPSIPASFHSLLVNRRVLGQNILELVIEIKEKTREFDYKWAKGEEPLMWDGKLCWKDLDDTKLEYYLKSCEIKFKDYYQQMMFFDRLMNKLIEKNGGPITREQFEQEDHIYWERRFANQAFDNMVGGRTGVGAGDVSSIRRATAPTILDDDVNRVKSFPTNQSAVANPMEYLDELDRVINEGIESLSHKYLKPE